MTRGQSFLMAFGLAGAALALGETGGQKREVDQVPYKQLTAADFRIDDRAHPEVAIYTEGFMRYRYKADVQSDGKTYTAKVAEWKVESGFDRGLSSRKSWLMNIESILPHEQGHQDINEIWARTLAKSELPTGEGPTDKAAWQDLDRKLQRLADEIGEQDRREQMAYDRETLNGRIVFAQRQWTTSLQKRMAALGISR